MQTSRTKPDAEELERQHARVGEWLTQMRAASDFLLGDRSPLQARRLADHYRTWVEPHFRYEEEHLFPAVRRLATEPGIGERLDAFVAEHRVLERRVEELLERLEALAAGELNPIMAQETARRCRLIIDRMMLHAAQEDDLLLPLLERHREALGGTAGLAAAH